MAPVDERPFAVEAHPMLRLLTPALFVLSLVLTPAEPQAPT